MLCVFRIAVICCALVFVHAGPAEARRVALVIGDLPLENPIPDAAAVAEALEKLQLDEKSFGLDDFRLPLYQLLRETAEADVGVFFGAGAEVLTCHRGAVGEGASCGLVFFTQCFVPH